MGVISFPSKNRMLPHSNLDNQIAIHVSFSFELQGCTVIDSPRYLDLLICFNSLYSLPWALVARLAYCLTASMALWTLGSHYHDSLVESHVACPLAGITLLGFGSRLGSASFTNTTSAPSSQFDSLHSFDIYLGSSIHWLVEVYLAFKWYILRVFIYICTPTSIFSSSSLSPKVSSEQIFENRLEILHIRLLPSSPIESIKILKNILVFEPCIGVVFCRPSTIIVLPFGLIGKRLVCTSSIDNLLIDLSKFILGVGAGIFIRMELLG